MLIIAAELAMAGLGPLFGFAAAPWLILLSGFLMTTVSNVFSNAYHVYQAELFPTSMRATAIGTAYSLSRLSAAILPFSAWRSWPTSAPRGSSPAAPRCWWRWDRAPGDND